MKLQSILLLLFLAISINVFSQEDEDFFASNDTKEEKKDRKLDRWSFGGNFGAAFGSGASYVELSPIAMYKFHPRLMAGPGFTYTFSKNSFYGYRTSTYGPRVLCTYTLLKDINEKININIGNIVLHSEFEYLNFEKIYIVPTSRSYLSDGRIWSAGLLAGGGIFQPLGNRGGISLLVLYSLIDNEFNYYSNPVIRIGFYF